MIILSEPFIINYYSSFSQCREDSLESTESDPLKNNNSADEEEEPDTDLETDRLLGHQRSDDPGFYDEKNWLNSNKHTSLLSKLSPKLPLQNAPTPTSLANANLGNGNRLLGNNLLRQQGLNSLIPTNTLPEVPTPTQLASTNLMDISESISSPEHSDNNNSNRDNKSNDQRSDESPSGSATSNIDNDKKKKSKSKEVLIEGVLFRAKYLGSTQLVCEGQPTKSTRMMQAEEAVSRIKVKS